MTFNHLRTRLCQFSLPLFLSFLLLGCSSDFKHELQNDQANATVSPGNPDEPAALSAIRYSEESYQEAERRAYQEAHLQVSRAPETVDKVQVAFDQIDASQIPSWDSSQLMEAFTFVRDARFLFSSTSGDANFLRRLTWLYPDDGCYARAHGMNYLLGTQDYTRPYSVFVFGNLKVKTPNHPAGQVEWWYHVAPIVKIDEKLYVLDPAIDPKSPLLLSDWILRQVKTLDKAKVSICNWNAFMPYNRCNSTTDFNDHRYDFYHAELLSSEWIRQIEMDRNPEEVLGDNPPWLETIDNEVINNTDTTSQPTDTTTNNNQPSPTNNNQSSAEEANNE
jgi:hypothetical protein